MLRPYRMRNKHGLLVMFLASLVLGACSDDDDPIGMDNEAPTAQVTASPENVPAGDGNRTVVTLDASGSSDPDGDALTFSWTVPSGTFVGGTTASDAIVQVTFPGTAPYRVTVTINDGNGGNDSAEVTVGLTASAIHFDAVRPTDHAQS